MCRTLWAAQSWLQMILSGNCFLHGGASQYAAPRNYLLWKYARNWATQPWTIDKDTGPETTVDTHGTGFFQLWTHYYVLFLFIYTMCFYDDSWIIYKSIVLSDLYRELKSSPTFRLASVPLAWVWWIVFWHLPEKLKHDTGVHCSCSIHIHIHIRSRLVILSDDQRGNLL